MIFSIQKVNHLSAVMSGEVTIRLCRSSYLASASQFFASGNVSKYFSLRLPFLRSILQKINRPFFGKCLCRTLYPLDFCPYSGLLSLLKKESNATIYYSTKTPFFQSNLRRNIGRTFVKGKFHLKVFTRVCFKTGGMPDWGRFFRQARRLDAGILTDFKSNQRSPDGKRCPKTAF